MIKKNDNLFSVSSDQDLTLIPIVKILCKPCEILAFYLNSYSSGSYLIRDKNNEELLWVLRLELNP